jgi:type I restriction enzyme S subunit
MMVGSTFILKKYAVHVPDEQTLQWFDELVVPLFREMESCTRESVKVTELRDALLPRLMSGEIEVKEVLP